VILYVDMSAIPNGPYDLHNKCENIKIIKGSGVLDIGNGEVVGIMLKTEKRFEVGGQYYHYALLKRDPDEDMRWTPAFINVVGLEMK